VQVLVVASLLGNEGPAEPARCVSSQQAAEKLVKAVRLARSLRIAADHSAL
jgi:HEPN domain-containing protein